MIAITAATGQLGQIVIEQLSALVPVDRIVAVARKPAKITALFDRGISVRAGDYDNLSALTSAFTGVDTLLLISSSEIGRRVAQHKNAIDAARRAGVKRILYTSLLHADTSPLSLATEHLATEAALKASGLEFIILRNGWYTENHTASISPALTNGAFIGSAGQGRISAATRADYAAAAVAALTGRAQTGMTYELAGDKAFTLSDLAAEISLQSGRTIPYQDLTVADYAAIMKGAGLPPEFAEAIAQWDFDASNGALFDEGRQLSALIGRPTTPLAEAVRLALKS